MNESMSLKEKVISQQSPWNSFLAGVLVCKTLVGWSYKRDIGYRDDVPVDSHYLAGA